MIPRLAFPCPCFRPTPSPRSGRDGSGIRIAERLRGGDNRQRQRVALAKLAQTQQQFPHRGDFSRSNFDGHLTQEFSIERSTRTSSKRRQQQKTFCSMPGAARNGRNFGISRTLKGAQALQQYFATAKARKAIQLPLVSQVADQYVIARPRRATVTVPVKARSVAIATRCAELEICR